MKTLSYRRRAGLRFVLAEEGAGREGGTQEESPLLFMP